MMKEMLNVDMEPMTFNGYLWTLKNPPFGNIEINSVIALVSYILKQEMFYCVEDFFLVWLGAFLAIFFIYVVDTFCFGGL